MGHSRIQFLFQSYIQAFLHFHCYIPSSWGFSHKLMRVKLYTLLLSVLVMQLTKQSCYMRLKRSSSLANNAIAKITPWQRKFFFFQNVNRTTQFPVARETLKSFHMCCLPSYLQMQAISWHSSSALHNSKQQIWHGRCYPFLEFQQVLEVLVTVEDVTLCKEWNLNLKSCK